MNYNILGSQLARKEKRARKASDWLLSVHKGKMEQEAIKTIWDYINEFDNVSCWIFNDLEISKVDQVPEITATIKKEYKSYNYAYPVLL